MAVKVAPSILSGDFAKLGKEAERMEKAGADMIHCDVMDGVFVPNLTFGHKMVADIRKHVNIPLDVHLMIVNPEKYLDKYVQSGADRLSFHYEATKQAKDNLVSLKNSGVKAGLAICPDTPAEEIFHLLDFCDFIVVMGVHPGFSGQKYIPTTTEKIRVLHDEILRRKLKVEIEMDGGANESNVKSIASAGVKVMVSGSCAFNSPTPETVISDFRNSDQ
ncbi:MAG: ribulose-phosphate 3-epimerase [Clostridia bacterium]|nr:ribulose-phosphate 3-epimerase [Clostridia bacterium]